MKQQNKIKGSDMKDIDFEELDKAVNRFLGGSNKENPTFVAQEVKPQEQEVQEIKPAPRDASELHVAATMPRRSGRFMDIMPAAPRTTEPKISVSAPAKPLRYTSKVENPTVLLDDFKEVNEIHRHPEKVDGLQDVLEVEDNVEFEEPALGALNIENAPPPSVEAPQGFKEVQSLPDDEIQKSPMSEHEDSSSRNDQVEPVLLNVESGAAETIIQEPVPQESGLINIDEDDNDLNIFSSEPATEFNQPEDDISDASEMQESETTPVEDKAVPEVSQKPIEETPLTTPFLPNARVEKRPLGYGSQSEGNNLDSKLVNSGVRNLRSNQEPIETPILSREEYATPVKHNKKKSGWPILLAIILIIAIGAGLGALAWYFLMA
ncbi:hypothetical protein KBE46_02790 [Candidatus Saccharibacteria bacterium]|nr:hypothetical protein [Candidatus Saccharibacteria bacterium]MBP9489405.1 hypothetical protein [Candidatus Saccharibacteria bacterium]MBP9552431.1 hypothetical protein [Candidatus Saccharibacteria bacterium]